MERILEQSIKRARKIRFFIEREIYNREAGQKYEECRKAIESDQSISGKERERFLADLEELFIFDLKEMEEVPSVFICPLSSVD